jgi:hypothetical protein
MESHGVQLYDDDLTTEVRPWSGLLDSEKKMQVLSSMRCGGSLTYPKKVLQDRVRQADGDALRAEEDRPRIRQLESKM